MRKVGLIGGTGVDHWGPPGQAVPGATPYGEASGPVQRFPMGDFEIIFIPRHGAEHCHPPHGVNYRANIHLLKELQVTGVLAVNAVGGIAPTLAAGDLVVPDQLIDYTWGRAHTFSDSAADTLQHIEFAQPFDGALTQCILQAARDVDEVVHGRGCLGVTQGPRLETAAEIRKLRGDGCDLVGMTSMPEAALAREAGLPYASLAVVANRAAAEHEEPITMIEIERILSHAMVRAKRVLTRTMESMT
jgi:5'-deoxy-5'-methylthioadenosine phosphorylase